MGLDGSHVGDGLIGWEPYRRSEIIRTTNALKASHTEEKQWGREREGRKEAVMQLHNYGKNTEPISQILREL